METNIKEQVEEAKLTQRKLKEEAHQQWLNHPVTRELAHALDAHETSLIESDNQDAVKVLAAVRTVRAMRRIILTTPLFVTVTSLNQQ